MEGEKGKEIIEFFYKFIELEILKNISFFKVFEMVLVELEKVFGYIEIIDYIEEKIIFLKIKILKKSNY